MKLGNSPIKLDDQLKDFKRVTTILDKIDRLSNDFDWADKSSDELYLYQPFLISLMLRDRVDLPIDEFEETARLYTAIWEYFKTNPKTKIKQITAFPFERFQDRNFKMLAAGDPSKMGNVTVLQAVLFEQFKIRPALMEMETQTRATVLIGIKTLIDCFEEIVK